MRDLIQGEEIFVATSGNTVVGFVSVVASDNFIHHLYVTPEYQSCGIGSALIDACKERFGLPLKLKCERCNTKAMNYYRNQGWTKIGEGAGDFGPWDELCMSSEEQDA